MVLKTILDYYEAIQLEYPNIPECDIKRILLYGWKSLYLHNSYGADVLINRQKFWFYSGLLMNDSLKYFNYYKRKLITKMRILYKRTKVAWDGYYYFALSLNQYDNYLKLKNSKGRPRKNFKFGKVMLYKLYDECSINEHNKVALFRVPMISTFGFKSLKDNFISGESELLLVREPLKFTDILTSNYLFKSING